jgi:hypothetical protein
MNTPTKKAATRPKSDRRINKPEFTRLDRDTILGDIEIVAEAEGWSKDLMENTENEIDEMPMYL